MKPRDYCCCAIPVVNVGIYSTLTEQFVLGILAGTLSISTSQSNSLPYFSPFVTHTCCLVVGASATPSSARWIFAVICYVGAIVQVFGFIGVAQVHIHSCPHQYPWPLIINAHRRNPLHLEDTLLYTSSSRQLHFLLQPSGSFFRLRGIALPKVTVNRSSSPRLILRLKLKQCAKSSRG